MVPHISCKKNFLSSKEKAPKAVTVFFDDPLSELYILFIHSQTFLIDRQIKKIEKSVIIAIQIKFLSEGTKTQLNQIWMNKYLGNQKNPSI